MTSQLDPDQVKRHEGLLSEGRHVVALGDLNLEDREIGHVASLDARRLPRNLISRHVRAYYSYIVFYIYIYCHIISIIMRLYYIYTLYI